MGVTRIQWVRIIGPFGSAQFNICFGTQTEKLYFSSMRVFTIEYDLTITGPTKVNLELPGAYLK